jgi:hypothetical protein
MHDDRLLGAAYLELGSVRIHRGYIEKTRTLNILMWAVEHFREAGDLWNGCAAELVFEIFEILARNHDVSHLGRAVHYLKKSGLSHNAYNQTIDDIERIYEYLKNIE